MFNTWVECVIVNKNKTTDVHEYFDADHNRGFIEQIDLGAFSKHVVLLPCKTISFPFFLLFTYFSCSFLFLFFHFFFNVLSFFMFFFFKLQTRVQSIYKI